MVRSIQHTIAVTPREAKFAAGKFVFKRTQQQVVSLAARNTSCSAEQLATRLKARGAIYSKVLNRAERLLIAKSCQYE
ncbi:MAG: hypothetical protein LBH58_11945 [Tannerellaceae bacterium]|nr:hypothetical protein [Tannerellaceae bacterium]